MKQCLLGYLPPLTTQHDLIRGTTCAINANYLKLGTHIHNS